MEARLVLSDNFTLLAGEMQSPQIRVDRYTHVNMKSSFAQSIISGPDPTAAARVSSYRCVRQVPFVRPHC